MRRRRTRIDWARAAERDLESTREFLRRRSPRAAKTLMGDVLDGVERLELFPEIGPVAEDLEPRGRYRYLVVRAYKLIYRYDGKVVTIVRFWDARRNPAELVVNDEREL